MCFYFIMLSYILYDDDDDDLQHAKACLQGYVRINIH